MIETITPAVCGSRRRQRVALALFALGAVTAAAAVGAALGLAGDLLGGGRALLLLAGVVTLAAAAREAGLVRLPVPQARRQVPERWHAQLPLPVWSAGYGAGLGAGFLTYQPVATFWVACAGALALARPLSAALCLALYGLGRAATVAWPRGDGAAAEVVERLAGRRRALARGNVAALVACLALLAAAPVAHGADSVGSGLDPSLSAHVLARAQIAEEGPRVRVEPPGEEAVVFVGAAAPSLDGERLAYVDSEGIVVVAWRTGEQLARVTGPVSKPALAWPLLAYHRQGARYERLVLADLEAGTRRNLARAAAVNELGRPALGGGRVAWHKTTARSSRVVVQVLASGRRSVVAKSKRWLHANPAVTARRVLWVQQRSRTSFVRWRRFGKPRARTAWRMNGRARSFWTTALHGRTAYVTRWRLATGEATLYRVKL